jgi:hypothetical protein
MQNGKLSTRKIDRQNSHYVGQNGGQIAMNGEKIRLKIDVFTPQTLPMSRLAEYLKQFALMVGYENSVHFSEVCEGSADLLAYAEPPAVSKLRHRAQAVVDGSAPKPALKAFAALNDLLVEDAGVGEVFIGSTKVIEFPGRRGAAIEEIGPVRRNTSLDGQIFSIGGRDETINVHLRSGERETRCIVSVDLARRLAPYLFGGKVRLVGSGSWYRVDSVWQMRTFTAVDFVPIDSSPLDVTLGKIRKIFDGVSPDDFMSTMSELREG